MVEQESNPQSSPGSHPTEATGEPKQKKVHPIIIYPFKQPEDYKDLEALYQFVKDKLIEKTGTIKSENSPETYSYSTPITVVNEQTHYNNTRYQPNTEKKEAFENFLKEKVKGCSHLHFAWGVDSCQMWLEGIGKAFSEENTGDDVYWLIPGDFNYSSQADQEKNVFDHIFKIPEAVMEGYEDFCIGEIEVGPNSSKQLIDTYGTYGLLYNWFPYEAKEIRRITDKPRTEFWAINHSFLRDVLRQRWYAYEQTIVILLQGIIGRKRIDKIELGKISDLPQGREKLSSAMQQVERTERVLKLFWRERNESQGANWIDTFRKLDAQSEQIRGSALVILQNLLQVT